MTYPGFLWVTEILRKITVHSKNDLSQTMGAIEKAIMRFFGIPWAALLSQAICCGFAIHLAAGFIALLRESILKDATIFCVKNGPFDTGTLTMNDTGSCNEDSYDSHENDDERKTK
jgi:hypothetical protein